MRSDGVSTAFQIILEELDEVGDEIKEELKSTLEDKGFRATKELVEVGETLDDFSDKVAALKEEWATTFDDKTRNRTLLELIQPRCSEPSSYANSDNESGTLIGMVIKNAEANARVDGVRNLTLLPGSTVCKAELPSLSKTLRDYRAYCLAEGKLVEVPGKDLYEVVEPISFRSPSAAAKFVSASSINGADRWVVEEEHVSFGYWRRCKLAGGD